jgi:hypothetical protein
MLVRIGMVAVLAVSLPFFGGCHAMHKSETQCGVSQDEGHRRCGSAELTEHRGCIKPTSSRLSQGETAGVEGRSRQAGSTNAEVNIVESAASQGRSQWTPHRYPADRLTSSTQKHG